MSQIPITWEPIQGGYAGFAGPLKVAVLGTCHDQGFSRNGQIIMEPQPRETWGLHFTSPSMPISLLKAILDSLPAEAMPLTVKPPGILEKLQSEG